GATLMLLAVGTLILGLLQGGQAWPWLSLPGIGVFVVALLIAFATVAVERRAVEAIMPGWLWRHPVLVATNLAMIGMGVAMMGPSTYLPTFGQAVLGLGAIAAGFVLSGLSLGWPIASSLSGRLYLRIGFRDTALIGTSLLVLGALIFLALPQTTSAWVVAADQFLLGSGFGLLSTPLLVGVQSTVGWRQRGVVTGANIFSRYLGQSIGAAVFGALFNGAVARKLAQAPTTLRAALPRDINGVLGALHQHQLPVAADQYLRSAIYTATHHVYAGILVFSVATMALVLWTPRKFSAVGPMETAEGEAAALTPP
ncbi:MAG: MFS transporter, partial [Casimicrobiaceae bacterium]